MSNNLKVNARTKPLELKKKHNLLVKKVEDMEGEIPSSDTITNLANQAIQADKDILSQIEYDEEEHTAIFPKGIVPLKCYEEAVDEYVFLDYVNKKVVFYNNVISNSLEIFLTSDKRIGIRHTNMNISISELVYIYVTEIDQLNNTLEFNSYYLFYPSGTQLYKHVFTFSKNGKYLVLYVIGISKDSIVDEDLHNDPEFSIKALLIDENDDFNGSGMIDLNVIVPVGHTFNIEYNGYSSVTNVYGYFSITGLTLDNLEINSL